MATAEPQVSILLPAWNAAATLGACLRSIARQTFTSWECVVVDDGSTDATAEIAADAACDDTRFRALRTSHQGLVAALNVGLTECRAPLIARMDADDVMRRQRLAAQVQMLEEDPKLAAVGCYVRIFPRRGMSPRLREYEAWLNGLRTADEVRRDAFVECPVAHPTFVMRREVADLRYQDRGWPEDYDLILRAITAGMQIGVVPRRLHAWRDRPESISRTDPRYTQDRFIACKAHYLAAGFLASRDDYVLWGYGGTGRVLRRELAGLGKHPSHIVEVKAGRLGQQIHGAAVIPPAELSALRGTRVVVSVARGGPRAEIRAAMTAMGFVEGSDYICAA